MSSDKKEEPVLQITLSDFIDDEFLDKHELTEEKLQNNTEFVGTFDQTGTLMLIADLYQHIDAQDINPNECAGFEVLPGKWHVFSLEVRLEWSQYRQLFFVHEKRIMADFKHKDIKTRYVLPDACSLTWIDGDRLLEAKRVNQIRDDWQCVRKDSVTFNTGTDMGGLVITGRNSDKAIDVVSLREY